MHQIPPPAPLATSLAKSHRSCSLSPSAVAFVLMVMQMPKHYYGRYVSDPLNILWVLSEVNDINMASTFQQENICHPGGLLSFRSFDRSISLRRCGRRAEVLPGSQGAFHRCGVRSGGAEESAEGPSVKVGAGRNGLEVELLGRSRGTS